MNKRLLLLFLLVFFAGCSPERRVEMRFAKLEKLVESGATEAPADMVIYRYDADTLQSWVNVFPIKNDALTIPIARIFMRSPLYGVTDSAMVTQLGNRDFLLKSRRSSGPLGENLRVVYGLDLGRHKAEEESAVTVSQKRPNLLFSPLLYAGRIFHSLGYLLIFNLLICILALILLWLSRKGRPLAPLNLALAVAVPVIVVLEMQSIGLNSNIALEPYKLREMSVWTGLVYLSFVLLFLSMTLSLKLGGVNVHSQKFRLIASACVGFSLLLMSAVLGFDKECNRLSVWAERLSIDRDIPLELRLRRSEEALSTDRAVPQMMLRGGTQEEIADYVISTYFSRISQDYDISVISAPSIVEDPAMEQFIARSIREGEPITQGSRYNFVNPGVGRVRYTGLFMFLDSEGGVSKLLIGVESIGGRESKGYARIFRMSPPINVDIPSNYTFARYKGRELQSFRGNYPYPTYLDDVNYARLYGSQKHFLQDSFRHFVTRVTDDELVLISRPVIPPYVFLIAAAFLSVIIFLILSAVFSPLMLRRERHFYRYRISYVLLISQTVTMVFLVAASIFLVSRRDNANMRLMMADKVNSIRSMLESRIQEADLPSALQEVSEIAGTDVVLYDPRGKLLMSTDSEVFDRMYMGGRINSRAYSNIVGSNKQYFIQKERFGKRSYYSMYAPLRVGGKLVAILCSPYTDDSFDFERDAVMHSAAILTVFLILLYLAMVLTSALIDRMLGPLGEMGRKMSSADLNRLEHISYEGKDEIRPIVTAYNRMVDDLSESSRRLAQAERDKAWTGMARQVAHEIKNPLTPMKLQIQRLIRLKQKGDGQWQEKFDEVCKVVLDHIDILADTAGEFSLIAQLPTEQKVPIDLGKLIPEEISMFNSREDIRFDYYGLESAMVEGPKPQLTRVIVNLLTNAVQALEGRENPRIIVSLRKSSSAQDAFDIVVEDSGPGVSDDNVDKLFTANFTTKSSGSGLGLAISKSILERCGATITYNKSFSLGGASFVICYPASNI